MDVRAGPKRRLNAEELMVSTVALEKILRVPWTAKSNLSILKEINPEYTLEGLMLKLKLQYFDHLRRRVNTLEKTLILWKTEGERSRDPFGEGRG